MTLPARLIAQASARPDGRALVGDDGSLTWSELVRAARRIAEALVALGAGPGDRVGLIAANGVAWAAAAHGVLLRGAVLVPLPTTEGAVRIGELARRAGVRAMLHDAAHAEAARAVGVPALAIDLPIDAAPAEVGDAVDADALAAVLFTSGTTGAEPRAVRLTHGNLAASAAASAAHLGTGPGDRWLACLPLFHTGGLAILMRAARDGFCVEVHDGFEPRAVARALAGGRVTHASLVARALARLLDLEEPIASPALRAVLVGGGPSDAALLDRARAAGLPVVRTYGMTETASQVATQVPGEADASCGRALLGAEITIDAPDGSGAGEVLVRGPMVSPGHDGEPPRAPGAWLRTGDFGRLDAQGRLFVLARRTDRIVSGGENVSPHAVEEALATHPAVIEAGAFGVPDPEWGARVAVAVRLRADTTDAELIAHCRAALPAHAVPRAIVRVDEPLPRTALGKLRRGELGATQR